MANADIRDFYFYEQYLWTPTDFSNLQTWLRDTTQNLGEGAFGAAVLQGLAASAAGGLNVAVASGIAVNQNGRPLVYGGGSAALVADASNPRRALIVLRPVDTNTNLINQPTNPVVQVPLHKQLGVQLTVILGTPGVNPAYPSKVAGDVIVMGVLIPAAASSVSETDFDYTVLELPRKRRLPIKIMTGGGVQNILTTDEIIEVDSAATGTTTLLPLAAQMPHAELRVLKIDSSANQVAVSGQGGELISGQASHTIEDQWGYIRLYSNGKSWRIS